MKTNMGSNDRIIRLIIAVLIVTLYLTDFISGTWAIVLLVFAGILIITSLVSTCPLYLPFGISTRKEKSSRNVL